MFDKSAFDQAVKAYTDSFAKYFSGKDGEIYKWIAVKEFQDNWDINAHDFYAMLQISLGKTDNLLESGGVFARSVILQLADQFPEEIRGLFANLYDESKDLYLRIKEFKDQVKIIHDKQQNKGKNHFQTENTITTYLWLRYPDKYYIYKIGELQKAARILKCDLPFVKGHYEENINNYLVFFDAIREELSKNDELVEKLQKLLTDDCYPDPKFNTLAIDFVHYLYSYYGKENTDSEPASNNDPTLELPSEEGEAGARRYWLYAPGEGAAYWDEFKAKGIIAIGWEEIGDLKQYHSKSEMKTAMKECYNPDLPYTNAAHATWQFAYDMKPGDIVYVKKGQHILLGRGIVESDYIYDESRSFYNHVRKVKWIDIGEWPHPGKAVTKTLTEITAYTEYREKLRELFENETDEVETEVSEEKYEAYDKAKFLKEVYMDPEEYDTLVDLLMENKNLILQGAPGVGKTYSAQRLAYSIMGEKNPNRAKIIQFHQSYSYEDFIVGFRPTAEGGFAPKYGVFYEFCKQAEMESDDTPYFFIIDEINRGNLSKIFGELFMLLEADKRNMGLQLLYSDEIFSVPSNVYIIGTMNTADRSLAMMDYALRRRFYFYDLKPAFNLEGFKQYIESKNNDKLKKLIACVEELNNVISQDDALGEGFCIGHSFFCNLKEASDKVLERIVKFKLEPLLKEYWFDEPSKIRNWSEKLENAIK